MQVAGSDHGLDHGGEHALGHHERRRAVLGRVRSCRAKALRQQKALGDRAARHAGDRLCADLGKPARAEALGLQARIQMGRDGQREHAVAEESQPIV